MTILPYAYHFYYYSGIETLLNSYVEQMADKITPCILKCCAAEIAPILQIIFKHSQNWGILPSDWFTANMSL